MEKEDILSKSRNENEKGDELYIEQEKRTHQLGLNVTAWYLLVFWILAVFFDIDSTFTIFNLKIRFIDFCGLGAFLGYLCEDLSKYYYFRRKRNLITSIFYSIAVLVCLWAIFIK